jgi:hypothetical protein
MIEKRGDFWKCDGWKVIPTNGVVRSCRDGFRLVMGAGVAAQALEIFPRLDKTWGDWVRRNGNIPCAIPQIYLVSFPIQHYLADPIDLALIRASALHLAEWACREDPEEIVLPRVSAGKQWQQIRPLLESLLDDRFIVLS